MTTSPCPRCKKHSKCGCGACIKRNGFDEHTATFDESGELKICPHCKQGSSPDAWLDAEWQEMKEQTVKNGN
jgi:hypothetical protein